MKERNMQEELELKRREQESRDRAQESRDKERESLITIMATQFQHQQATILELQQHIKALSDLLAQKK